MLVLGIETTCDETAAAVVRRDEDGRGEILSNVVLSQAAEHQPYGGVVPEIAARAHVEALDHIITRAMIEANASFSMLDGVAAAAGPGLIGGVIVGLTTAKAIALVAEEPLIAVNHLEAHALAARMEGEKVARLSDEDVADRCAAVQQAVVDVVIDRLRAGLRAFREKFGGPTALVVAGGVAVNQSIRRALNRVATEQGTVLVAPPPELCTDNGAMIAWAGCERLVRGLTDTLDVAPRARWALDGDELPRRGEKVL